MKIFHWCLCVNVRLIFYGEIHFCHIFPYFSIINISLYSTIIPLIWVLWAVATVPAAAAAEIEEKYYLTKNGARKFLCEYSGKLSIYMHFTTFRRLCYTHSTVVWNMFFLFFYIFYYWNQCFFVLSLSLSTPNSLSPF